MPLSSWINKLENLENIIADAMEDAVDNSENTIIEMQKDRMELGIDTNGKPIEFVGHLRSSELTSNGAYTKKYANYKTKKGGQTAFVDLELTGKYKNGLKAKTQKTNDSIDVDIESNVEYEKYIKKNYDNIYGLSKSQEKEIKKEIANKIEVKVKNYLSI